MSLFESLELWDALILCYRMLQKVPQAKALVLARLQVSLHVVKKQPLFTWMRQSALLDTDTVGKLEVAAFTKSYRGEELGPVHVGSTFHIH